MREQRKVLSFYRRRGTTTAARITRWLNTVVVPARSGHGVLAVNEGGELFEGRRVRMEAFIWVPAGHAAQVAYSAAIEALTRRAA